VQVQESPQADDRGCGGHMICSLAGQLAGSVMLASNQAWSVNRLLGRLAGSVSGLAGQQPCMVG
jgi:hypothetical protein